MSENESITIIGGGLAGSEAAWQAVRQGVPVILYEMRPLKMTEAHRTALLGELVCSNSLRSRELTAGAGVLKAEMSLAGSLIMQAAEKSAVPAGSAFAVDRLLFAGHITDMVKQHPLITVRNREIEELPETGIVILATGPLTSSAMAESLKALAGEEHLHFYDALAPIVDADSIDHSKVFAASRYDKGGDDYLNCPMDKEQYGVFYTALVDADTVAAREFENMKVFEGCMPIEVMAERGPDTLRFGPLKPVGLRNPATGEIPYAVVQLRPENREKTAFNLVGFQTRLKWPEQKKVFRMIPGLENVEFLRYGAIHRNTFINAPKHLNRDLSLKRRPNVFLAGQISGVEGYIESTAMGLLSAVHACRRSKGLPPLYPPDFTAHGALVRHLVDTSPDVFQPSNINFGLIPAGEVFLKVRDKKKRRLLIAERALEAWKEYCSQAFGMPFRR